MQTVEDRVREMRTIFFNSALANLESRQKNNAYDAQFEDWLHDIALMDYFLTGDINIDSEDIRSQLRAAMEGE